MDPGTRSLGYGLIDLGGPSGFTYVECGLIRPSANDPLPDRLLTIATALQEIIAEFRPDTLAIEQAYYGRNASSTIKLGEARGVILLVARQAGLSVGEYSPARVKRAVVGKGRATKHDMQQRVAWLCGLQRLPGSDAADALAIAWCHAQNWTLELPGQASRSLRARGRTR